MLRDALARATPASMNDTSIGVYARLRPGAEADTEVEVKRKAGEQRHVQVRNLVELLAPGEYVKHLCRPPRELYSAWSKQRASALALTRCATSSSRSIGYSTSTRPSRTSSTAWPRYRQTDRQTEKRTA